MEEIGSLDNLVAGESSEGARESDGKVAARAAAAAKKIAGIKKDEKKSHQFDDKLAKILRSLSAEILDFVIFLIDHEIPSLTILAMISLASDAAGKICFAEFHKFIAEPADFSIAKFSDKKIEEKISFWWTFIFAADFCSRTIRLKNLRENKKFTQKISVEFSKILKNFLIAQKAEKFDAANLKKILQKYAAEIFAEKSAAEKK